MIENSFERQAGKQSTASGKILLRTKRINWNSKHGWSEFLGPYFFCRTVKTNFERKIRIWHWSAKTNKISEIILSYSPGFFFIINYFFDLRWQPWNLALIYKCTRKRVSDPNGQNIEIVRASFELLFFPPPHQSIDESESWSFLHLSNDKMVESEKVKRGRP